MPEQSEPRKNLLPIRAMLMSCTAIRRNGFAKDQYLKARRERFVFTADDYGIWPLFIVRNNRAKSESGTGKNYRCGSKSKPVTTINHQWAYLHAKLDQRVLWSYP